MNNVFVLSDPHFGHENVSKWRKFASVEEMNELIVLNWNSIVQKKDTVYLLGDITMEKKSDYPILNRLNGYKKVILGNHDAPRHIPELLKYVNWVAGVHQIRINGVKIWLTHTPMHPREVYYGELNIHGHVHDASIDEFGYFNASCENINYTPKRIVEIVDDFKLLLDQRDETRRGKL